MVAGGLRPLRAAVHPDGVAQRGHLPRPRRARRRRIRSAALCAAQQLARQREPRQGATPVVADQAEIRPQDLVGRSHDPHRQRCARIDGLQDVWLRRRTRGQLGARRFHLLGPGRRVAGGRPLFRRSRAAASAWRCADGPHLRQSGRAEQQAGSIGLGARHPRNVQAHGDERRGNRRADRRRPYIRQDPRRGGREDQCRPRTGRLVNRRSGLRLEEQIRLRQRQ
jgi:hypothetical protein